VDSMGLINQKVVLYLIIDSRRIQLLKLIPG